MEAPSSSEVQENSSVTAYKGIVSGRTSSRADFLRTATPLALIAALGIPMSSCGATDSGDDSDPDVNDDNGDNGNDGNTMDNGAPQKGDDSRVTAARTLPSNSGAPLFICITMDKDKVLKDTLMLPPSTLP